MLCISMFVCPSACLCGYPSSSVHPSVHPSVRPVWLSVSLSARLKCFADPQTLMLPTLLNSSGITKYFNSPLDFKPSALGIITNFELKTLIIYQNVPADRSSVQAPARPPYHISALRSPAGSPRDRSPAHPPAQPLNKRNNICSTGRLPFACTPSSTLPPSTLYYIQSIQVRL